MRFKYKIGDNITCHTKCFMGNSLGEQILTEYKKYIIKDIHLNYEFSIIDDTGYEHWFSFDRYEEWFYINNIKKVRKKKLKQLSKLKTK